MPLIQATILAGRTAEAKKAFYEQVTAAAVDTLGVKPEQVRVIIHEMPHDAWIIGGVSKADLDARAKEGK